MLLIIKPLVSTQETQQRQKNDSWVESYLGPRCDSPIKVLWIFLVKFEQRCRADFKFALFTRNWSGISGAQRIVHGAGDQSSP